MKQIGNWVFGSFFRTIGRLLVFVLLGLIIANMVDFGNIFDNFRITDLFLPRLDALTITSEVVKNGDTFITQNNPNYTNKGLFYEIDVGKGSDFQTFTFTLSSLMNTQNSDYITIPLMLGIPQDITVTNQEQIDYDYCHRWNCTTFTANGSCQIFTCNQLYTNTDTTTHYTQYQYTFENFNMSSRVIYEDNGWNTCTLQDSEITCPTSRKKIKSLEFIVFFNPTRSSTIKIDIGRGINFYQTQNIQGAVENQTQQQHSDHQQTQSYLEDSNTTQAESEATDFFDDFSVDLGGLTGIITAPLTTIQSLLNSTCTNLVLPLPFVNENLTLPCMSSIYSDHFGAFYTLYQTIILGIIAYRCIMSIFFDIKGFTNPDDDRIEVMDL